jgi:hypothetical protein
MEKTLKNKITELPGDATRQYINARSVFTAYEEASKKLKEVRGGMVWREQSGSEYLIRTSVSSKQKSLGPRSEKTETIYHDFISRKNMATERIRDLRAELEKQRRINKALRVGRAPDMLVEILNRLVDSGVNEYFTVIGTHSLYAYEAAAGIMIHDPAALATIDVDLLWDVRKRIKFISRMDDIGTSFLGLLKKIDKTFERRDGQLYTAVNSKGFEVDVVRRPKTGDDPHPVRLTDDENELFAVEINRGDSLINCSKLTEIIVSETGKMARMNTVSPHMFVKVKRWLAEQENRDQLKKRRDILQANIVEQLIEEYLLGHKESAQ